MNKNITGATMPTLFVKNICESLYSSHSPKDFIMPSSVKRVALDKKEFLNHNLVQASPFASEDEKVYDIFAKSSLPPQQNSKVESKENKL